jgi:hypothetical protein
MLNLNWLSIVGIILLTIGGIWLGILIYITRKDREM